MIPKPLFLVLGVILVLLAQSVYGDADSTRVQVCQPTLTREKAENGEEPDTGDSTSGGKPNASKFKAAKGSRALERLAELAIPVPRRAYNATGADAERAIRDGWDLLNFDFQSWQYTFEYFNSSTDQLATYIEQSFNVTFNTSLMVELIGEDLDDYAMTAFPTPCWDNATRHYGTNFTRNLNNYPGDTLDKRLSNGFQAEVEETDNKKDASYYRLLGTYMGVGMNIQCKDHINNVLSDASEWDKAGASAATTLMALIPALLTFGNLFVPRSSEVFATSFLVGVMSAVFSLGLPVTSISGISRKSHLIDVAAFGYSAKVKIPWLGKLRKRELDGTMRKALHCEELEKLQAWSEDPKEKFIDDEHECENVFWKIKMKTTQRWQKRAHYWHIPAFLICCIQVVLFILAIGPLFLGYGTPLFMFDCNNFWTSLWLLISAAISAVFRLMMWQRGCHERVTLWPLSHLAIKDLREKFTKDEDQKKITARNPRHSENLGYKYMLDTTETEVPPLYPPILRRTSLLLYRAVVFPSDVWGKARSARSQQRVGFLASLSDGYYATKADHGRWDKDWRGSWLSFLWAPIMVTWKRMQYVVNHPGLFLRAGYERQATSSQGHSGKQRSSILSSARRFRPLIVLMHLSTRGRNPLATLFTGLIEGALLILLTIFFGSQWGGNLLVVSYTVLILLLVVTAGRALGIWYVWRSTYLWGLHIIESETAREIMGCLRILCSMTEVLVLVNGAYYFEGYRLDVREGWEQWRLEYESGMYDGEDDHRSDDEEEHDPAVEDEGYDITQQVPSSKSTFVTAVNPSQQTVNPRSTYQRQHTDSGIPLTNLSAGSGSQSGTASAVTSDSRVTQNAVSGTATRDMV